MHVGMESAKSTLWKSLQPTKFLQQTVRKRKTETETELDRCEGDSLQIKNDIKHNTQFLFGWSFKKNVKKKL